MSQFEYLVMGYDLYNYFYCYSAGIALDVRIWRLQKSDCDIRVEVGPAFVDGVQTLNRHLVNASSIYRHTKAKTRQVIYVGKIRHTMQYV